MPSSIMPTHSVKPVMLDTSKQLPDVGNPETPKKPKMMPQRGLSGPKTPKIAFLFCSSNHEPVCMAKCFSECTAQVTFSAGFPRCVPLLSPQLLNPGGTHRMASPFQVLPTHALSLCAPKEEAPLVPTAECVLRLSDVSWKDGEETA